MGRHQVGKYHLQRNAKSAGQGVLSKLDQPWTVIMLLAIGPCPQTIPKKIVERGKKDCQPERHVEPPPIYLTRNMRYMKYEFLRNIQNTLIDHDAGDSNSAELQKP